MSADRLRSHQSQVRVVGVSGAGAGVEGAVGDAAGCWLVGVEEGSALDIAVGDGGDAVVELEPAGGVAGVIGCEVCDPGGAVEVAARLEATGVADGTVAGLDRPAVGVGVFDRVGVVVDSWVGDDEEGDGAPGLGRETVGVGRGVGPAGVRVRVGRAAVGVGIAEGDHVANGDRGDDTDGRGLSCGRSPRPHDTSMAMQATATAAETTSRRAVLVTSLLEGAEEPGGGGFTRLLE